MSILGQIASGIRVGWAALMGDPNPTATPADPLRPGQTAALAAGLQALGRAGFNAGDLRKVGTPASRTTTEG